jgi:3-oxoacyl-[acyl-carrier protein] reductase
VALELAAAGYDVALNALNDSDDLRAVEEEIVALGRRAVRCPGDVGVADVAQAVVDRASSELGTVHTLVHTIGIRPRGTFLEVTPEDWDHVMRVNLTSLFLLMRAAIPGMVDAGWGRIVALSGRNSVLGLKKGGHVSASKTGMEGLVLSVSHEFAPKGITANIVVPGTIDTTRQAWDAREAPAPTGAGGGGGDELPPVGRLGTPHDIAAMCTFLASDDAGFVTGQVIHVNGGVIA